MVPHRPVKPAEVSTPSVGIENSEVAVDPSVTVIDDGLNVMAPTEVVLHGFVTSIVIETSLGLNEVVAPCP